jgi:hypothetical protein
MKTLLVSAAVLGLTASASFAAENGPMMLTDAQMDGVTAGQQSGLVNVDAGNVQVAVPVGLNAGVCVIVERCTPTGEVRIGRIRNAPEAP